MPRPYCIGYDRTQGVEDSVKQSPIAHYRIVCANLGIILLLFDRFFCIVWDFRVYSLALCDIHSLTFKNREKTFRACRDQS